MKALVIAVLALFIAACQTAADAPVAATPIQAVLAQGKDDQRVVIRGQVVSRLDDETYVVADNTGTIRVEIDADAARRAAIGVGTHLEVSGEIDTNVLSDPKLEAKRVVIVSPQPVALPSPSPGK